MSRALGPIAAQRERNAQLLAEANRLARRFARCAEPGEGEPGATTERAKLPVVLLPANTRETALLPDADRVAFLEQLRGTLVQAFLEPVRDNSLPMSAMAQAARDDAGAPGTPGSECAGDASIVVGALGATGATGESAATGSNGAQRAATVAESWLPRVLGASCATCRGECCTAGGTHAFLRVESLVRVRAQQTSDVGPQTVASLEAAYSAHLPERHYRGSCVYHTPTGCALPRAMRSDLCNRYLCGSLTQLTRALDASGARAAFVAAADSRHLRRVAEVSPEGARPLPLR